MGARSSPVFPERVGTGGLSGSAVRAHAIANEKTASQAVGSDRGSPRAGDFR
jgi:hypothetical protein